jgi:hypothetical protein
MSFLTAVFICMSLNYGEGHRVLVRKSHLVLLLCDYLSTPHPLLIFFFWRAWGLNSGLCTCKASAVLLYHTSSPFCSVLFLFCLYCSTTHPVHFALFCFCFVLFFGIGV